MSCYHSFTILCQFQIHICTHLCNTCIVNTVGLLRSATKEVTTPIDKIFGGVKLNTVICRECQTVSSNICT